MKMFIAIGFVITFLTVWCEVAADSDSSVFIYERVPEDSNTENFFSICPNNRTKCQSSQTCCLTKHKSYHCCKYKNAVCCSDHYHCCPEGSTCDVKSKRCNRDADLGGMALVKPSFQSAVEWRVETTNLKTRDTCPNNRTKCKDSQTCCLTKKGNYHCCKYSNAVCCSDKYHCCPEDTTCDLKRKRCIKNDSEKKVLEFSKGKKHFQEAHLGYDPLSSTAMCPNNKTKCKDTKTCCITKHGNYYCCPHKNAVCCSDKWSCCPEGTTCDLKNKKCVTNIFKIPDFVSRKTIPAKTVLKETSLLNLFLGLFIDIRENCVASSSKCSNKATCCDMEGGKIGCCGHEKGVCCNNGAFCCPQNTFCDSQNNVCLSKVETVAPRPPSKKLETDLCPDNITECFSWETCCPIEGGAFGCCPKRNATCCPDKVSCCPHNTKCDVKNGKCLANNNFGDAGSIYKGDIVFFARIPLKTFLNESSSFKMCPDKQRCSSGTCCPLSDQKYGCCIYESGVCCPDKTTCCPTGTKCTVYGCS